MKMLNFYKNAAKRLIALALAAGVLGVPQGYEALHLNKAKTTRTYSFVAAAEGETEKPTFSESTGTAIEDDELTQVTTQTTPVAASGFEVYTTASVTTIPSGPLAYVGDQILGMEAAAPWDEPEMAKKVQDEANQKIDVRVPKNSE